MYQSKLGDIGSAVLTEREVREILRLSKVTLVRMRRLEDRGGLPFVRLSPGRIGYLRRDVCAFLEERRVGSLLHQETLPKDSGYGRRHQRATSTNVAKIRRLDPDHEEEESGTPR